MKKFLLYVLAIVFINGQPVFELTGTMYKLCLCEECFNSFVMQKSGMIKQVHQHDFMFEGTDLDCEIMNVVVAEGYENFIRAEMGVQ